MRKYHGASFSGKIYLQIGLSGRYAFRRFVAGNTHGISGDRNVGAGRIIKRKGQNGGQIVGFERAILQSVMRPWVSVFALQVR
ncbi:hypothetical protein [Lonsdalea quercina]|uniref:hypothetical protein n=1 Tax=Lonsdalea quercina TaxID=71657 RepID=UPI0039760A1B